jgi:hypothetical protein
VSSGDNLEIENAKTRHGDAHISLSFFSFSTIQGDLTSNVSDNGIGELHSKRVARQIAAALEYMHLK